MQDIFSKLILRELLLKAAGRKSSNCFQVFRWLETPYYSTRDKLARCLPALHALTGCDTTSQIATKHAAIVICNTAVADPGKEDGEGQCAVRRRKILAN